MDDKKIDMLIDKLMEGPMGRGGDDDDGYTRREPDLKKHDVDKANPPPQQPVRYEDWLKQQPKSNVIGIHKRKKK